ncbi:MAG: Bax inhibitor-1 family protein, partial [Treponema sp.]|nr:Bax inhibitor-1 family protein [Treponema sp.]
MENFAAGNPAELQVQNKFIAKVYGWMALALFISAATAFGTALYAASDMSAARMLYGPGYIVLAILEIGLVWWLSASIRKISPFAATVGFLIYSMLNGVTLSSIFIVYRLDS